MIGVFDSGVGGLSVLRVLRRRLPEAEYLYVADQGHVPYGLRPLQEVRGFAEGITRYLLSQGADLVIIACNTASAAALPALREAFPHTPFIGMRPAIGPAVAQSRSRVIGVLATQGTFRGELYASAVRRFAQGVTVLQDTCPGLVEQIEAGKTRAPETRAILERALTPMLARGVDTVVLGCTHFPFAASLIREIVGPEVGIIDPAPAIARQVEHLWRQYHLSITGAAPGRVRFATTGDAGRFREVIQILLGESAPRVESLIWEGGNLRGGSLSGHPQSHPLFEKEERL